MSELSEAPEGYKKDGQGRLVPNDLVKDIDLARDDIVKELIHRAVLLSSTITGFKASAMGDIQAFVELSAEKYGAKLGGNKGNVTLLSYDGRYKIQRSIAEYITFDERLQVAKELIDNCIHRWSEGSGSELKALVEHAFQADKQGKISTERVLGLRKLDITDPEWKQAMTAISDSIQMTGSKTYVRFYERIGDSDQWKPVSLDIASL